MTGGERKETLGKVAARYNISFNRFDPFAEARTTAQVASLGAGAEVIAFENESEVVVSRHRSPGKGGWSQNRYVRKIHGAVQAQRPGDRDGTRCCRAPVREEGDPGVRRDAAGWRSGSLPPGTRCRFPPTAGRMCRSGSAGNGSNGSVSVRSPAKPRYLIVGIDPGTTTAVAALDLDGNLLHLASSRQMNMSDVIESLYKVGKPLIIASDVQEMPFTVEKIRRAFSAIAYTPETGCQRRDQNGADRPFPVCK